ncbi:proton-coupled amino acid transporter-like protein pathetic [Palaemon carinicauda]|uniref:proton-coupled amino acid transporter-like protein pathetic n=1 Tax=Palaemon carinicauda TaxID=392227 RepID=UPI0035B69BF2
MPQAFMNSGLWVGLAGIPIMGLICVYCVFRLVHCSRALCLKKKVPALSYDETVGAAFEFGPECSKKYSNRVAVVIKVILALTQMGFGCIYLVFIAQNMKHAIDSIMITGTGITNLGFLGMAILPVLLVCFAPNLKSLAPFSLVAGVVQFAGLVIIIYYCARSVSKGAEKVPAFNSWTTMPLYLASTIYAFEGIGLVLPLESQMKNPEHLLGYTGVLSTSTFLVICLYATIGFYGYLSYGNSVLGSISLNLPQDEGLAQAVKITMAISIYLTYPLQVYVVFDMLQPLINSKFSTNVSRIVADYSSRTCIVLLTFGLAAAIPNIGLFISLVGAFSSTSLSLIFPPIIDILTFWDDKGRYNWKLLMSEHTRASGSSSFTTPAEITRFINL